MGGASLRMVSGKTVKPVCSRKHHDKDTKEKNRGHKGKLTHCGAKPRHRGADPGITDENIVSSSGSLPCLRALGLCVGSLCLFVCRRRECSLCVLCVLCVLVTRDGRASAG